MKTKISRWATLIGLAAGLSLPAIGAGEDAYVSRSEYEQLKKEFTALQAKMDRLARQEAAGEKTPAAAPAAVPPPPSVAAADESPHVGLRWEPSFVQPGWERIRADGWMEPGRANQMNARIAQGEDFQLFMGLQTAGRFQALTQNNVYVKGQPASTLTPGFQTAWGSMDFLAEINPDLEVYFDVYLSSMAHQDYLQGHEGYMLIRGLSGAFGDNPLVKALFEKVNVRAGQFDIDFGDQQYRRTDNARGQPNALVGNSVVDPSSTEIGVEVMSKPGRYNWMVGVGSGSETGGFQDGRGLSAHAKFSVNLDPLRLSVSAYHLHHALANSGSTNLFKANRSGGQYQGVLDNGSAPGQIQIGSGRQLDAVQTDLTWTKKAYEFYGNVGWARSTTLLGGEEWFYYTGEGIYRFTPRLYAAARYSGGLNRELLGVSDKGMVNRYQIGGGYWLAKTILFKLEYVYQDYTGFKQANGLVSGIDAWRDPAFNGVISEITFSF